MLPNVSNSPVFHLGMFDFKKRENMEEQLVKEHFIKQVGDYVGLITLSLEIFEFCHHQWQTIKYSPPQPPKQRDPLFYRNNLKVEYVYKVLYRYGIPVTVDKR